MSVMYEEVKNRVFPVTDFHLFYYYELLRLRSVYALYVPGSKHFRIEEMKLCQFNDFASAKRKTYEPFYARRDAVVNIKRKEQTENFLPPKLTISYKSCIFIGITHSELYISGHVNFYGREFYDIFFNAQRKVYSRPCVYLRGGHKSVV